MDSQMQESGIDLGLSSKVSGGEGKFSSLLLEGKGAKRVGVILIHGRDGNPDSSVVGPLRRSLNLLGYTTLSIQNDDSDLSEAFARIRACIKELKGRGISELVLLGFSMGVRIQTLFLAQSDTEEVPVSGLIAISSNSDKVAPYLDKITVPFLDVCGEGDTVISATVDKRKSAYNSGEGKSFTSIVVKNSAPHNFAGFEEELENHVHAWISSFAPAT